jgi:phosphatidylglycerol:prolipoprotein diacylglycerol transferase
MIPVPPLSSLQLGPVTIHFYGVIIASAILLCYTILLNIAKQKKLTADTIDKYFFTALPLSILGARLYHVTTNLNYYLVNPYEIFMIWKGGLGLYGGILTTILVFYFLSKKLNQNLLAMLDLIAIVLPLGQAIGRWGNYFNQELFGKPTSLPWALYIDNEYRPENYKQFNTFHPTFLYESLLNSINFIVLYVVNKKTSPKPGMITSLYLVNYGAIRLLIETLKIDPDTASQIGPLRIPQYVSMAAILAGTAFIIKNLTSKHLEKSQASEKVL